MQLDSGFMHKQVYWAEDKVIYMLDMGYFVSEDDNGAEIEAEVDDIISEWMKSFWFEAYKYPLVPGKEE